MQNIIETFRKIGQLKPENEKALLNAIEQKNYPAKTILQNQGQISNKIYFIEKGIARTFYYKDGKDITYWIASENNFVGSMTSYFMQVPSNKLVETIDDCILCEFEFKKLETLFKTNHDLADAGRLFAIYGMSLLEQRFDNLHFNSAKERYDILMNKQPDIIQRVPLGMIASYLGVTQETLSRIRNNIF